MADDDDDVVIEHPNRRKASSQLARLVVIVLLIASAAVVLIISLGGWDTIEGAKPVQIAFIVALRRDGALRRALEPRRAADDRRAGDHPRRSSAPSRRPPGSTATRTASPTRRSPSGVLGLLCALLVLLQIALMLSAMIGFRQKWNVEVERRREAGARLRCSAARPRWRNGRLGGLKNLCPYGRAGSNPALGIRGKRKRYLWAAGRIRWARSRRASCRGPCGPRCRSCRRPCWTCGRAC